MHTAAAPQAALPPTSPRRAPSTPSPGVAADVLADEGSAAPQALADEVARAAARLDDAGVAVEPPPGHPTSLALCVLAAVWTPRVAAPTTAAVVRRFRDGHGVGAGAPELVAAVASAGGDAAWATSCATSHRVWSHPDAPLKASAARLGAQALVEAGVCSAAQLRALLDQVRASAPDGLARGRWDTVRDAWCAVPGQRSGRSWHRLVLLAGAERVVPDEDVRRFVSRWVRGVASTPAAGAPPARAGRRPDAGVAADLLEAAARAAGTTPRVVDHVVWRSELLRGTPHRRTGAPGPSP